MRLLYIVSKGMNDPTLASVPLHIAANGSLEVGQDVSVVLAGDATDLVIGENAQHMEGVGVPPMRELLSQWQMGGTPRSSEACCRGRQGAYLLESKVGATNI